jgi:hypothetical protein
LIFRELKHPPSDTLSARRMIDIHPPQFQRITRDPFKAEETDDLVATDSDPKTAIPLAVVVRDTINFF